MKRIYRVTMIHKMRSVQEVEAHDEDEARGLAYDQSFEEEDWEEVDTSYNSIRQIGIALEEDDEEAAP